VFDLTLDGIQQMNRKSFMTGGVRSQTLRQSRRVQRKAPQQLARSRQQLSCVAETKTAPAYFATYNEKKNVAAGLEDAEKAPMNTYSPKKSYEAEIVSVERIVGPNATGETCHIVIKTDNNIPFWEGQSYGIVPPGTKVMPNGKEKAHAPRLYSIASSRYGDTYDGNTTSLCVRRATYWCPEKNAEDDAKKGICSNFLCDAKPGDKVQMTGPVGASMILPDDAANKVHIMVATGTGIAPYRSYWRRMFLEDTPFKFTGLAWLFMGVANSDAKLYDDELQEILTNYPDQFRVDYALSREQTNRNGGKMYIQDKMEEYADQIFDLLEEGAILYVCGLKGMMPGINDMLEKVAAGKGKDWKEMQKDLKKKGQWHLEVY
jgi:ferredoxin--NADP+ reductase